MSVKEEAIELLKCSADCYNLKPEWRRITRAVRLWREASDAAVAIAKEALTHTHLVYSPRNGMLQCLEAARRLEEQ